jgi:hypothetical protein
MGLLPDKIIGKAVRTDGSWIENMLMTKRTVLNPKFVPLKTFPERTRVTV